jgi:hypothetical protein
MKNNDYISLTEVRIENDNIIDHGPLIFRRDDFIMMFYDSRSVKDTVLVQSPNKILDYIMKWRRKDPIFTCKQLKIKTIMLKNGEHNGISSFYIKETFDVVKELLEGSNK